MRVGQTLAGLLNATLVSATYIFLVGHVLTTPLRAMRMWLASHVVLIFTCSRLDS